MTDKLDTFDELHQDLRDHVDVLIQMSETYYVLSQLLPERLAQPGGSAFRLLRQALGMEIVGRLYRLIETSDDGRHFHALRDLLSDDALIDEMLPTFNHDGRKSRAELTALRAEILKFIDDIHASDEFKKVDVYRQRYVGHRVPNPRKLAKHGPSADVHTLSSADLRRLTDGLAVVCDKVAYARERSMFASNDIAAFAKENALALWGAIERA